MTETGVKELETDCDRRDCADRRGRIPLLSQEGWREAPGGGSKAKNLASCQLWNHPSRDPLRVALPLLTQEGSPLSDHRISKFIQLSMNPYIELHAASAFSFLDGASLPEELARIGAELGMPAMALLDRDGVYGGPQFHKAATKAGIQPHIGAELTSTDGSCYPLLAESRRGYQNICRLTTRMKMRATKGGGSIEERELEEFADGLIFMTGGEHGPLTAALRRGGLAEARQTLASARAHFRPRQYLRRTAAAFSIATKKPSIIAPSIWPASSSFPFSPPTVCVTPRATSREILDVFTCLRHYRTLETAGRSAHPQCRAASEIAEGNDGAIPRSSRSHRQHQRAVLTARIHFEGSWIRVPSLSRAGTAKP